MRRVAILLLGLLFSSLLPAEKPARAQVAADLRAEIDRRIEQVMPDVVAWRRDIHAHPELSNREVRTAGMVADHLRALGLEVETEVAHTGVVGVLRGGRPGPVVALRADMDALPVTEMVGLPFASTETAIYLGEEVGVMHACGHDNHVAILMGAAEVLAGMRDRLPGTIKFIFQPAEEGAPEGEEGGAELMVEEGVLEDPAPGAIFGLHVWPDSLGKISYRPGGLMAAPDQLRIVVHGRQTHGAIPWGGVDPVVASAQIINALQTVVSRRTDLTEAPAVVSIGRIEGGIRHNIIPDSVLMVGTIRTLNPEQRTAVHEQIRQTVRKTAEATGAKADVRITLGPPVTFNDPALTERMASTLQQAARGGRTGLRNPQTVGEDFAFYQQEIPGLFFFLGITPEGEDPARAPRNHSPYFFADEGALPVGVRAMTYLAFDYLLGR